MYKGFGGPSSDRGNSGPFFVASGLVIISALLTLFLKPMTADGMKREDEEVGYCSHLASISAGPTLTFFYA